MRAPFHPPPPPAFHSAILHSAIFAKPNGSVQNDGIFFVAAALLKNARCKFCLAKHALPRKVHAMQTRSDAEEHLRIIRSLMEKATIYRAISAPTALAGGIFAVLGSVVLWGNFRPVRSETEFATRFLITWGTVLLLTTLANTFFLWRASKLRGEPFLSSGMRLALVAMLPGMLCGLFFTAVLGWGTNVFWLPPIWMMCYAVALLATKHFAPRSIMLLGWTFLLAGMASFYQLFVWGFGGLFGVSHFASGSHLLMGVTFGLFHLIYAACTWPRRARGAAAAARP